MAINETKKTEDTTASGPIQRGNKGVNQLGNASFFGSRLVEPFLQYGILKHNWAAPLIHLMRGTTLPQGPPVITNTPLDRLGLSPYRTILLTMSIGSMAKQNYWLTAIMQEPMSPAFGLQVGVFNAIFNTANSILFVCTQTSASVNGEFYPQTPLIVGSALYGTGLLLEWLSEQQRHAWKKDPANKGKVYSKGLFGLSRHINYFGYALWRAGYAVAAGGYIWGAAVFSFFTFSFLQRGIPELQAYLEERYGQQYEEYKRQTPYKYVPYIY